MRRNVITEMGTVQDELNANQKGRVGIAARIVIILLRFYHRWISPLLGPICRFYPSCSVYAVEVISTHGLAKGGWLAAKRLLKCNPLHPGGVDLPPAPPTKNQAR